MKKPGNKQTDRRVARSLQAAAVALTLAFQATQPAYAIKAFDGGTEEEKAGWIVFCVFSETIAIPGGIAAAAVGGGLGGACGYACDNDRGLGAGASAGASVAGVLGYLATLGIVLWQGIVQAEGQAPAPNFPPLGADHLAKLNSLGKKFVPHEITAEDLATYNEEQPELKDLTGQISQTLKEIESLQAGGESVKADERRADLDDLKEVLRNNLSPSTQRVGIAVQALTHKS